ncbi:hypothetical protein EOT10_04405 [Streptomyces antnestii]|uniref:Uncharacterized protein n=1 Tax=Streptomyces antnestii TaxID=2494256 RepID=A0A3S3UKK3_9ACTN|nr:hypothetical protein [Streptomyces sp. San01]RVU29069.1 hypothetical protein EOT10_04405 [Streptomyces sp. San01]
MPITHDDGAATWKIGEPYDTYRASRHGNTVIRPAVHHDGTHPCVITSAPCRPGTRRIPIAHLTRTGPWPNTDDDNTWPETCTHCGWHYRLAPVYLGSDKCVGLYGIAWTSRGFWP